MTSSLISTIGDDILVGTEGPDASFADAGMDVMVGAKGRDTLHGGSGNDTIVGGGLESGFLGVSVELSEEDPTGIFYFNRPDPLTFAEFLKGQAGDDVIVGGSWHDKNEDQQVSTQELVLGSLEFQESWGFNNVMWGGAGNDQLHGANGFDTMGGGAGDDILFGYGGVDRIYGGAGNDTISGGAGEPELFHREEGGGSTHYEELYGGAGNDEISGGEGPDRIFGGSGNDLLRGGEGSDTLKGGLGRDIFDYTAGTDTIADFNLAEDTLSLEFGLSREQYKAQSSETTIDGVTGVLISINEKDTLFLSGLKMDDFDSISMAI